MLRLAAHRKVTDNLVALGIDDVDGIAAAIGNIDPAGKVLDRRAEVTGVVGGVLALVVACSRGYLRQAMRNIWLLLMFWRVSGVRPLPELTIQSGRGPKLAYGVSIFLGTVVTIWLR